ncbi:hypothetical protein ACFWBF_11385 [Streptomyces sp. NPDC060028]|uniref:hypothetical protein n=1 Tax=Streptomyces sp. NPDC060028 TaxID=3347041 RepID=UPI0036CE2431
MDRIARGHHLYPGPDGSWRHSSPDGHFTRIRGPHELLSAAQKHVYGAADPAEVDENGRALRAALHARGVLTTAADGQAADADTAPWSVHIEGDNPIAHAVAALLPPTARLSTGPLDEEVIRAADSVVSCAGWLPDARWQQIDDWCKSHATTWHRCHAEGLRFVLGPLSVPGSTVGYADTRGRILAAAGLPDELAAHWAYLDHGHAADATGDALPPVPWPGPAAAAVLAGLLVEDLLRLRTTGTPAARNVQLVVDASTATVSQHLVLPLPVTAGAAG